MSKVTNKLVVPEGFRVIYRAWKTDKDGNRIYAREFGYKAWPIVIPLK
jgi:hypothetical protein